MASFADDPRIIDFSNIRGFVDGTVEGHPLDDSKLLHATFLLHDGEYNEKPDRIILPAGTEGNRHLERLTQFMPDGADWRDQLVQQAYNDRFDPEKVDAHDRSAPTTTENRDDSDPVALKAAEEQHPASEKTAEERGQERFTVASDEHENVKLHLQGADYPPLAVQTAEEKEGNQREVRHERSQTSQEDQGQQERQPLPGDEQGNPLDEGGEEEEEGKSKHSRGKKAKHDHEV